MTALAQGCAGLALVMGFALLACRQATAAAILLAVQSAAVAMTAVLLHQPLLALPPLALAVGIWLMRHETPDPPGAPAGGAKLGIGIGAVLAILCQSLGVLALPSAIVLLSILLAATRSHRLMQVVALVAMQNGLALAGGLIAPLPTAFPSELLFPISCLALPLPFAVALLAPAVGRDSPAFDLATSWTARWPGWVNLGWVNLGWIDLGWVDLGLALAMAVATLVVPIEGLASAFAPLLALDGVLRSWVRRTRPALPAYRRGAALAQTGFIILAVCTPNLMMAWLAVLAAVAMALLPALSRRWDGAILAFMAAGLALFGLRLLPAIPPVLGWFSLFAGFAIIAAVVPDLAVVLVILILRLANQAPWPASVESLGIGLAVVALLACALLLANPVRRNRTSLLLLGQASIAALIVCTGQAQGRFAALVLLILLILSRTAARIRPGIRREPASLLATASLAGVPPLGVFPGLILVVLALSGHDPWLLLPVGAALIPIVLAGLPAEFSDFSPRPDLSPGPNSPGPDFPPGPDFSPSPDFPPGPDLSPGPNSPSPYSRDWAIPSIAWLPLLLAALAGYFAPEDLVNWWHILTAGRP
jgi:hypothetical protein